MLSPDTYNLWFAPLCAHSQDAESLILGVANEFCEVWLMDNYLDLLRDVVALSSGQRLEIKFKVVAPGEIPVSSQKPAEPTPPKPAAPAAAPADRRITVDDPGFNPNNTFEAFVVGNNNNFASAAALAVAQNPGKCYNPLFLYGGVGLGKTHLLHAIGHYILGAKPGARVAYVSSEKFTNEYIDAIQNNLLVKFRRKYRQTDALLIDDIQFLAGKERIQEEFFHTFNTLHDAHRQIVMTCDRPASEIKNLEQRMVSRFEWGLVADLQPPDVEMRQAILRKKSELMGLSLPEEVMVFLATRIRTNIRRLEGALVRVASYTSLTRVKPTLEVVEALLREILHEEGRTVISIETIQKRVAETYDIRMSDMISKRRPENIAFPRQVAMYLSRQLTTASLSAIGDAFGGRDHGTVMHACRLVKGRMDVDPEVRQKVLYLEKLLVR